MVTKTRPDQSKAGLIDWWAHTIILKESEAEKQSQYAGDCGDRNNHTAPICALR